VRKKIGLPPYRAGYRRIGQFNRFRVRSQQAVTWTALTRRVEKERPSRRRSTSYTMGFVTSPGRRKYEWNEWQVGLDAGTVACTAASA
jgi:hypothetical protein